MSLYYDANLVLSDNSANGSLKSRIFNHKSLKSTPGQIYALISESAKWSLVLKVVIEKAGILPMERKVHMNLFLTLFFLSIDQLYGSYAETWHDVS